MRANSRLKSVLLLAGIGIGLTVAQPAAAQALGDADCPGGYYYACRAITSAFPTAMIPATPMIRATPMLHRFTRPSTCS